MSLYPVKMMQVYLCLWKMVDVHLPGHELLEISPVSFDQLNDELEEMMPDASKWADDYQLLIDAVDDMKALAGSTAGIAEEDWKRRASALRARFQDKALSYAVLVARSATRSDRQRRRPGSKDRPPPATAPGAAF